MPSIRVHIINHNELMAPNSKFVGHSTDITVFAQIERWRSIKIQEFLALHYGHF